MVAAVVLSRVAIMRARYVCSMEVGMAERLQARHLGVHTNQSTRDPVSLFASCQCPRDQEICAGLALGSRLPGERRRSDANAGGVVWRALRCWRLLKECIAVNGNY